MSKKKDQSNVKDSGQENDNVSLVSKNENLEEFSLFDSQEYSSDDEKSLVELANKGDSLAITMLVVKYRSFLIRYVSLLNIDDGYKEDFIQEGLIGLLKAVRTFDPEKGYMFSTYAWKCIKNSIFTELRHYKKRHIDFEISIEEVSDEIFEEVSSTSSNSPENIYIDMESSSKLHDTIFSVLSPYEAQVFGMYLAEMPYSLIACRLGKDVKSIDNAIQRIKTKLKKLV